MDRHDTLPRLTRALFEAELAPASAQWWATGEGLIHRPEIMEIDGWNLYGGPRQAELCVLTD